MSQTPPDIHIEPARRAFWERVSVVWIIPLIALLIALGVAWQSFSDRGPLIEITFDNSEGIKAGQTELRYRDVTVGLVEKVSFSEGLSQVVVAVRVDKDVAPFIDAGASFWVVRPQVTARGVSGLDTVLSGVFIEGVWDNLPETLTASFAGLSEAPLIKPGEGGLQIALRSTGDTVLSPDTPIFYRGVEVGRMGQTRISPDGSFTVAEAIIFEPHDQFITGSTRFWDISGFSFSLGAGGASIDFISLASLIGGGVTFGNLVSGGERVSDGTIFEVFEDEDKAKASIFNASDVETLEISAVFADNVAGLVIGAPVELRGIEIGEVTALNGIVDRARFGDARVRLNATLSLQPARLGLPDEVTPEIALAFLAEQVADGLRVRLATASILTGGLKVEMVRLEQAVSASVDLEAEPFPVFPTSAGNIANVSATAEGLLTRVNDLPVEELLASAIRFLDTATVLVNDPDLKDTPGAVRDLVGDMRGLVGSDAAQNLPAALNTALARMETLLGQLEEERAVARLIDAVDQAAGAAEQIGASVEGVPALVSQLNGLVAKAEALPFEVLVSETSDLIQSADALIGSEAVQTVPASLNTALGALNETLEELRAENGVPRLLAAIDAASVAAEQVGASVEGVPALIDALNAVAARASTLPLEDLVGELTELTASADALIGTQDARELPGALADALAELQATLSELRAGGVVENVNETMASTRRAAEQIAGSVEDLPAVMARMTAVLEQASDTLQSYDSSSELNRGARDALREVQKAAEAMASLARTIERNPNSLLLGR